MVGHDWTTAVPLARRGVLRRNVESRSFRNMRNEWTPKHPVAYAVRRLLLELEPDDTEEQGIDAGPKGGANGSSGASGSTAANLTAANHPSSSTAGAWSTT